MSEHYKLTTSGKLFFASLVSYLNGGKSPVKLKASPEQIKAIAHVVQASKEFQEEIKNPEATIDSITEKMRQKNLAIAEFVEITGKFWPL